MSDEDELEGWDILPEGTVISAPNCADEVVIKFQSAENAIFFFEVLRSFVNNEIDIEIVRA